MIQSPCMGCEERHIGCHSVSCAKWVDFCEKHEEESRKVREKKMNDLDDYYTHKRRASSIKRAKRKR